MEDTARAAGVSNTELRARSADYIDFSGQRERRPSPSPRDSGDRGPKAAGLLRRRSPPLDIGATSDDEATSPSKRETQLSPHMRSGEDARIALQPSTGSCVKRSSSLPERCYYEPCKPVIVKTAESSVLPTNPDWLKTKLAALREENEFPRKVRIRVERGRREKIAEVPSVLTGHGERTIYRSPSPRLRGEAALAIGEANKASNHVPWRCLPVYSKGTLCQTMAGVVPEAKRVHGLGEYSEKLSDSTAKELVYPDAQTLPKAEKDGQFEAWLLSVQTCLKSISHPPAPASSRRAGSPLLMEKEQHYKPLRKYVEEDVNIKDACPFARNDSNSAARATLAPTVMIRVRVPPPLTRRAPEIAPADVIQEKNRRWQFMQDMATIRNECPRPARRSLGASPRGSPRKGENLLLKSKDWISYSQSTLEPDQSTRTPLTPTSPLVFNGYQETLRPRWR